MEIERFGQRYNTGDINLASACVSCGVPLDPVKPVRMIESETIGRTYASFTLMGVTSDGIESTGRLMSAWSRVEPLPCDHPFSVISRFAASKPKEIKRTDDLFDYAIQWLREQGRDTYCPRFDDIPALVSNFPQMMESYVLGFVYNRDVCFQLCQRARREVHQARYDGDDMRQTFIDTRLPKWQRNELLSRLQG